MKGEKENVICDSLESRRRRCLCELDLYPLKNSIYVSRLFLFLPLVLLLQR